MSFRRTAGVPCLVLVASTTLACASETAEPNHASSAASDAAAAAPDAAAAVFAEPLHLSITVPDVAPGSEGTKCVRVRLGNQAPIHVGKIHNKLSTASHHFVVSTVEDTTLTEAPLFDCPPFRAPLTGAPLVITQKHDDLSTMPDGVAYTIADNQLMHLELHYLNTSGETRDVSGESDLYPMEATANLQEASFLLVGNLDISIPPRSSHSKAAYQALPAAYEGVTFYALTGHTHRFGTNVTVGVAPSSSGEVTPLYRPDPFVWDEPVVTQLSPGVKVPAGGGFNYQCDWYNPTDNVVTFGESALTEMCFFWAYYYPRRPGNRLLLQGLDSFRGDGGPVLAGPPCAGANDPGNDLGVGKHCSENGNECGGTPQFCVADYVGGEWGNFCSKTCTADGDCGTGASCSSLGPSGASSQRFCIPTRCIALLGASADAAAP
jgi:hypothetical protein